MVRVFIVPAINLSISFFEFQCRFESLWVRIVHQFSEVQAINLSISLFEFQC